MKTILIAAAIIVVSGTILTPAFASCEGDKAMIMEFAWERDQGIPRDTLKANVEKEFNKHGPTPQDAKNAIDFWEPIIDMVYNKPAVTKEQWGQMWEAHCKK